IRWSAPDRKAHNFTRLSPYSYCAGNPIQYNDLTGDSFVDVIVGALSAFVDDMLCGLTNFRDNNAEYADDINDYDTGTAAGDAASLVVAVFEISGGDGLASGGATVAVAATAAVAPTGGATIPVAAGGAGATLVGGAMISHGVLVGATVTQHAGKAPAPEDLKFEPGENSVTFLQGSQGGTQTPVTAQVPKGYHKINQRSRNNQKIFTNGEYYISPDKDGHNGGVWKATKKPDLLNKKETRFGTYDATGKRIHDKF
ncbi:MAG: toxin C-terminal domain-containing protein, partial [Muribaculaceae bacterium]|nr:toxin C-terminal domain-containing protein [Muribaculaceae bacterium]